MPEDYIKITIVATGFEKELSNNEDFVGEELAQTPAEVQPKVITRPKLVVGGDFADSDYLDIPAYMRQQQD